MPVSLSSVLSIARSALTAHQAGMQVVSDNIANANTPGYTRKRAEAVTGPPQVLPEGVFGTGIIIRNVTQARDQFLDASFREHSGNARQSEVRGDYLRQVEDVFGEPGDQGLGSTLDAFWNAWSDLANDPLNAAARGVVRERGVQVVNHLHRLSSALTSFADSARQRLNTDVTRVNELTKQIAALNENIVAAEAGGVMAGQLRDARNLALDELARFGPLQVLERGNGAIMVSLDSRSLVDAAEHHDLEVHFDAGELVVTTDAGARMRPAAGSIGAYLSLANTELPALSARLDEVANTLVSSVNALHRQGVNGAGASVDFFAAPVAPATTVSASSIALSAAVQGSASAIAAGRGGPLGEYRAGASDIATSLSQLRTTAGIIGNYTTLVADIGVATRGAADSLTASTTLAEQSSSMRESYTGVSTDEELVELIQLQNAYGAAARLVTTADEMMQTLLELKR